MQKLVYALRLCICLAILCFVMPLAAQDLPPDLTLRLRRDFGYGGMGIEIQGTFSLLIEGPDDMNHVVFKLDDEVLGELSEAPFRWQFLTDRFPPGIHTLAATGSTAAGRELHSNVVTAKFLSKDEAGKKVFQVVVPLVGGIFGALAIGLLFTFLSTIRRGKTPTTSSPRRYGLAGGAICPKCARPFARHLWAPNLVVGKLERCPHCGKWSIVARASSVALAAAEAAERADAGEQGAPVLSEEERLRRALEASRFEEV